MKKIILLMLIGLFAASLIDNVAMAGEEELSVTVTASSVYSTYAYYAAANAIDGDYNSYWLGALDAAPWWIMFDAGEVSAIGKINLIWYSTTYTPYDYDIQISDDGVNWENVHTGIAGEYVYEGKDRAIDREARYIRLYINDAYRFPVLREFTAYTNVGMPRLVRFQGTLGDAEENPLDGTFTATFRLYDAEAGGTPLWEETQYGISVAGGLLDVELGSVTSLNIAFDKQYWLGIEVESDGEMTPRFKLTGVPYAFHILQ